jgi:RNA polymerase sigma-70 factor (ECF subfamily)
MSDQAPDDLLAAALGPTAPDPTESLRLLSAAQGGDTEALAALVERYQGRLRRIVSIRLSAELRRCVESMDIVQETFASALPHLGALKVYGPGSLLQWLSRIAENQMRSEYRRHFGGKRDRRREVDYGPAAEGLVAGGASPPADVLSARRELERVVDTAVSELPEDWREVLVLRTYAGGSWEEVAAALGKPSAEAARLLHRRARLRLARMLRERLPGTLGGSHTASERDAGDAVDDRDDGEARDAPDEGDHPGTRGGRRNGRGPQASR